jgi:hypothetical protein
MSKSSLKREYLRAKLRKEGEFDKGKIPTYFQKIQEP